MEEAKKNTHKKILFAVLACLVLSGVIVAALILFGNQKKPGNVDLGDGFFTDVNATEIAEVGIEYQIPAGKALNGKKVVVPTVEVTLDGEVIETEYNAFVPTAIDDYLISYEYALPTGKTEKVETVLTVKDTYKPSILGADEIDTKYRKGDVIDFSELEVIDRSGETVEMEAQAYLGKNADQTTPLTLSDSKLKVENRDGYTAVLKAVDSSGNEEKIVRNIDVAADNEFEFANNEDYVKKYVYGEHGAVVTWNSDPEYVFEGEGSIKYEVTKDTMWPCLRFASPMITDISKAYAVSFWVYNDSDTEIPLYVCQKFSAKQRLTPHAWTKVTVTTEEMVKYLGTEKKSYAIASDMTMFQLMHNNSDYLIDVTLYLDTFMVEWEEPSFKIECGEQMVRKPGKNIVLDTPTVTGLKLTDLKATLRDAAGKEATTVTYKNGKFVAAKLDDGEYYVTYTYRNGIYGCMASQKILVSESDYDILYRYSSKNGKVSAERKTVHGKDGSAGAKYENGLWGRWSFVNIQDQDILPVTKADRIEFWIMYKKNKTSDFDNLTARLLTKSSEKVNLSNEISLKEGEWTKISLNAAQMQAYIDANDGLRLRMTVTEGSGKNDLSYQLYLDDFKVIRGGNKDDIEATQRYDSKNGALSASKDIVQGNDGSLAAKYTNGQWSRWSFITIDDSDVAPVTNVDSIEFWVMYKKLKDSDFDGLTINLLTKTGESTSLSGEITLTEGEWKKISLSAAQMQKYIDANDGLKLRLTAIGGENYLDYDFFIDDFVVVKGGNKDDIEATERYESKNGTFSASKDIVQGNDGSIAAKYTNGQWQRWSFITIDDSDVAPITNADRIEFWVMYKKLKVSDFDDLKVNLMTKSNQDTSFSGEITLTEGEWTKISLNAAQMKKYIDTNDGLRLRLTVVGGENHLDYDLFIDDFRVIKDGNREDVEATARYTSNNGTFSASKDVVQGTDGTIAAKYTNGQWQRWSFITIDDSDVAPITNADRIEFWVMYKKLKVSDFDDLKVNLMTKSNQDTSFSGEITLTEGEWTKISLNAAQMKKYIDTNDGLRLRLTVVGGENHLDYDLFIDDFKVVKDGNKEDIEATERYTSKNGSLSASTDWSHDTDGSIAAKYTNGQGSRWSFITIDDSDISSVINADSIQFWVMYKKLKASDFDGLTVRLITKTGERITLSGEITLTEGDWAKISLDATQMKKYIDANDGLKLRLTAVGGANNLGYDLYIDDFEVVKDGNKEEVDLDVTKRYTSSNGDIFAAETGHGEDQSVATKYINGQWSRWSFINIDDSDILPVKSNDRIEFWVMYRKLANSDFTGLTLNLITKTGESVSLSGEITLTEGEWIKISLNATQMKKYIDANDGMRLRLTAIGGEHNLGYDLYIDDFTVVRGEIQDVSLSLTSSHGTISTTSNILHDTDTATATKYVNGVWNRWSFITIDDSSFQDTVTAEDSIEFWAYLKRNTDGDWTSVSLALGHTTSQDGIRGDVTLAVGQWTKISLNASQMQKYIDANNGLRIRTTVNGGNFCSFDLYIDDFKIVKAGK